MSKVDFRQHLEKDDLENKYKEYKDPHEVLSHL